MLDDTGRLGPRVSRTKSGIPRIIPAQMRKRIKEGDVAAIRMWMTLFALYRVLEFPGILKLSTITDPGKDISHLKREVYRQGFLFKEHGPFFSLSMEYMTVKPAQIAKSSGTTSPLFFGGIFTSPVQSTSVASMVSAAKAFVRNPAVYNASLV